MAILKMKRLRLMVLRSRKEALLRELVRRGCRKEETKDFVRVFNKLGALMAEWRIQ